MDEVKRVGANSAVSPKETGGSRVSSEGLIGCGGSGPRVGPGDGSKG